MNAVLYRIHFVDVGALGDVQREQHRSVQSIPA